MSTQLATDEDFMFFDYLAPFRWQSKADKNKIKVYRELVATGELQIESILENALVECSDGLYTRVCENTHDHSDGGDAKKVSSVFRCNNIKKDHWKNTWNVRKVSGKTGMLRILALSKQTKTFYHFAIPRPAYKHLKTDLEIVLDTSVGYADPKGIPHGKWMVYLVPDFKTLATVSHETQIKKYQQTQKKRRG